MSNDTDAGCVPCEVCGGSQNRGWHKHPMTLTDFLLARIAEDEASAVCWHGAGCPNQDFEFAPGLTDCDRLNVGPTRWRAECEAKRRIVEEAQDPGDELFVRILALPYADHPDYNPDWRP